MSYSLHNSVGKFYKKFTISWNSNPINLLLYFSINATHTYKWKVVNPSSSEIYVSNNLIPTFKENSLINKQ